MSIKDKKQNIVIIGSGHAGVQVADSLRKEGYNGTLTLLEQETATPYQRPPLSKETASSAEMLQPIPLRPASFFKDNQINLRLGSNVSSIDRSNKNVELSTGELISYSQLVFATGAKNRTLKVPGSDLVGIQSLKTLADAEILYSRLTAAQSVVIVGAGFIGLEFAASAKNRGLDVTVLEYAERPMARALSTEMSRWFIKAHQKIGIDLRLNEGIASFQGSPEGNVLSAISTTGTIYPADLVLVGVGVTSRSELAEKCGLAVENGIVVDTEMVTSDPDIFAVGDCANFPSPYANQRTRLESIQNATDQAKYAAKSILGKHTDSQGYRDLPWFWSIQGKWKLQIAGLVGATDETVVRGDQENNFSIFCFREGKLTAVESVNSPSDHMAARRILSQRIPISPEQTADTSLNLRELARNPKLKRPVAASES